MGSPVHSRQCNRRTSPGCPRQEAIKQARNSATGIRRHEPDGSTNGRIRTIPRSKEIITAVDVALLHHWSIHNQRESRRPQTSRWPYQIENWLHNGLHSCDHDQRESSGRHPAITALAAACSTLTERQALRHPSSTSSRPRWSCPRNAAHVRPSVVDEQPSVQPCGCSTTRLPQLDQPLHVRSLPALPCSGAPRVG